MSQVNNLSLQLKELEEEQIKHISRREIIIQIRVDINEIKTRKTIERVNKTKLNF